MTGLRCGILTVVSRAGNGASGNARWNVRCDCGKEIIVDGRDIRRGTKTHCGCLRKKAYSEQRLCEYCGSPTSDKHHRFCSPTCAARSLHGLPRIEVDESFPWKKTTGRRWKCKYGYKNISCTDRDCAHCGWNPEVAQKRSEEFKKKMEVETV